MARTIEVMTLVVLKAVHCNPGDATNGIRTIGLYRENTCQKRHNLSWSAAFELVVQTSYVGIAERRKQNPFSFVSLVIPQCLLRCGAHGRRVNGIILWRSGKEVCWVHQWSTKTGDLYVLKWEQTGCCTHFVMLQFLTPCADIMKAEWLSFYCMPVNILIMKAQ